MEVTADEILALTKRADVAGQRRLASRLYLTADRELRPGRGPRWARRPRRERIRAAARRADSTLLTEM